MSVTRTNKYRARYVRKGTNPFKIPIESYGRNFVKIDVELTAAQAKQKDKLAKAATPNGYDFVECIRLTRGYARPNRGAK